MGLPIICIDAGHAKAALDHRKPISARVEWHGPSHKGIEILEWDRLRMPAINRPQRLKRRRALAGISNPKEIDIEDQWPFDAPVIVVS